MPRIKRSLIQENDSSNKSDESNFGSVSEIHDLQSESDLRFESEFDKTKNFSYIIAVIYAISLIILGLSLISVPTAISIYITLFVLLVVPIAIALYCQKSNAKENEKESESETSDLVDEDGIQSEKKSQLKNNKIFTNSAIHEINNTDLLSDDSDDLYQKLEKELKPQINDFVYGLKIEMNIKQILKLAVCFFIFAFICVAVNLIFLHTIFIYISLSILVIIIFSVGYKIHKINSCLKKLNDVNCDDYNDDIVTIVEETPEKNIESQNKASMSENIEPETNKKDDANL